MKITGTFLDEISHDIPSSNWGVKEWQKDFDAMKSVGIDTVILIRCGYKDKMTFESADPGKAPRHTARLYRPGGYFPGSGRTLRHGFFLWPL